MSDNVGRIVYSWPGQPEPRFTRNDLVVICHPAVMEGTNVMDQKALIGPEEDVLDWLRDPDYAGPMQHLRDWGEIDRMHAAAADEIEALRHDIERHVQIAFLPLRAHEVTVL